MSGKKKSASVKAWTLAGEPIYSSALAPAEERVFKEVVSRFRRTVSQIKEKFDRFSGAGAAVRTGEQAARASIEFFCKYFEGKYQRIDIVEALASAGVLPMPSAECVGMSPVFLELY